ncbi:MAG: hypothetical protein Ta2A_20600 [Treponemataceae bacterium]|nr:MAG: hypothetical protein Ta2A_20600 [Treponemataceae bacterium]
MFNCITKPSLTGFLAFPEYMHMLQDELTHRFDFPASRLQKMTTHGDLLFDFGDSIDAVDFDGSIDAADSIDSVSGIENGRTPWWAATSFTGASSLSPSPSIVQFDSIGDAAKALRELCPQNGKLLPYVNEHTNLFRRTMLIQEKLPYINVKPRNFPLRITPDMPQLGLYTLLNEHTLLCAPKVSSKLPLGKITFCEDHTEPPSRAYLKLWEALTVMETAGCALPQAGEKCFDAGGSPGGWTWALLKLGCTVTCCDRAPLAPSLTENPEYAARLTFIKHDAFTLPLSEESAFFDWIFSDVICYPERLLAWIKMLISAKMCRRLVCTIKLQGETDWSVLREFEKIENSFIRHLGYNKHELTFFWSKNERER